jgi:hypothetical protein
MLTYVRHETDLTSAPTIPRGPPVPEAKPIALAPALPSPRLCALKTGLGRQGLRIAPSCKERYKDLVQDGISDPTQELSQELQGTPGPAPLFR